MLPAVDRALVLQQVSQDSSCGGTAYLQDRGEPSRRRWSSRSVAITNRHMAKLDKAIVLERIRACGVVAVIRAPSKDVLVDISRALLAGGVAGIEVTMSTPDAIKGIE